MIMITLTDLFCGCGGSSEGARKVAGTHVKYAMNHWQLAVNSHNSNHPDTLHDCADISDTHPARYDRTTGLIASPECTNHSLSAGKRRKNLNQGELFTNKLIDETAIRSRATMWDVPRFAEQHNYEFIITENVVDVRHWVMFDAWLKAMHSLGYNHKCVYLNAMFAHSSGITGFAPQSRDRIYIVFWKKGNKAPDLNIRPKAPCNKCGTVEAVQSWKPNCLPYGKYNKQYIYRCSVCAAPVVPYYYAAINALDLSLPMTRIRDRKKPLSPKTMARIEYGLKKYGLRPTILDQRNQHGSAGSRIRSADADVLNAQSTGYSSYLFAPYLFRSSFSHATGDRSRQLSEAFATQTTGLDMNLVSPQPYLLANRDASPARNLTEYMRTQTTAMQEMLLVPAGSFIVPNQKPTPARSPGDALPTITGQSNSMSLIVPIHGTARPKQMSDALDTVMTTGHSSLILAPYHGTMNAALALEPTFTIPTRDSISLIDGRPQIEDCFFRMLQPSETSRAQGFTDEYIILGTKEDKQKQIGNANPPQTMELLIDRCVTSLL